jgi:D-alanyl-D-alanine carboxypeptidase
MDYKGFLPMRHFFCALIVSSLFLSCHAEKTAAGSGSVHDDSALGDSARLASFIPPASLPAGLLASIEENGPEFNRELSALLADDAGNLLSLVDKKHPLPPGFAPEDLVPLQKNRSYTAGRTGLTLRASAEAALEKMSASAGAENITLVVSSAYRSYDYQKTVYDRNVKELGAAGADRESAKPGTSQHQTGTAVDFGSITDDFAKTSAGKWLVLHAGDFGWSLSFPDGYESITGYRWESWHYRYIGTAGTRFQKKWFGGIQQYMLEYINSWKLYQAGLRKK